MAFLIRTIDITASGREIVRDRTVEKAELVVGRASESDIHLQDLAVEQRHVSLSDAGGGMLAAQSLGGLEFGLDGRSVTQGTIDPNVGSIVGRFPLPIQPAIRPEFFCAGFGGELPFRPSTTNCLSPSSILITRSTN